MTTHTPESVAATVREIIAKHLKVNPDRVVPDAALVAVLGADSLDAVEMAFEIEEAFDVELPDERIWDDTLTVRGLIEVALGQLIAVPA